MGGPGKVKGKKVQPPPKPAQKPPKKAKKKKGYGQTPPSAYLPPVDPKNAGILQYLDGKPIPSVFNKPGKDKAKPPVKAAGKEKAAPKARERAQPAPKPAVPKDAPKAEKK